MSNFLNTIRRKEVSAANLFIKNSQAFTKGDVVELARELTDLRVQLRDTKTVSLDTKKEFEKYKEARKEGRVFDVFVLGLWVGTLILVGISYIYIL